MSFKSFFGYELQAGKVGQHFPLPGTMLHLTKAALSGPIDPGDRLQVMVAVRPTPDEDIYGIDDALEEESASPVANATEEEAAALVEPSEASAGDAVPPPPPPPEAPLDNQFFVLATLSLDRPDVSLGATYGVNDCAFFSLRHFRVGKDPNAAPAFPLPSVHLTGYYSVSDTHFLENLLCDDDEDEDIELTLSDLEEMDPEFRDEILAQLESNSSSPFFDSDEDDDEFDEDFAAEDEEERAEDDENDKMERQEMGSEPIFAESAGSSKARRSVLKQGREQLQRRIADVDYDSEEDEDFVPGEEREQPPRQEDVDVSSVVRKQLMAKRRKRRDERERNSDERLREVLGLQGYDSEEDDDFVPAAGDEVPEDHSLPIEALRADAIDLAMRGGVEEEEADDDDADDGMPQLVPVQDASLFRQRQQQQKKNRRNKKKKKPRSRSSSATASPATGLQPLNRKQLQRRDEERLHRSKPQSPAAPLTMAPRLSSSAKKKQQRRRESLSSSRRPQQQQQQREERRESLTGVKRQREKPVTDRKTMPPKKRRRKKKRRQQQQQQQQQRRN